MSRLSPCQRAGWVARSDEVPGEYAARGDRMKGPVPHEPSPESGRDGFHHVPNSFRKYGDAVERVPTRFSGAKSEFGSGKSLPVPRLSPEAEWEWKDCADWTSAATGGFMGQGGDNCLSCGLSRVR